MGMIPVAECASRWGVAERTVRNYCAKGRIPGAVIKGKTWKTGDGSLSSSVRLQARQRTVPCLQNPEGGTGECP